MLIHVKCIISAEEGPKKTSLIFLVFFVVVFLLGRIFLVLSEIGIATSS